MIKSSVLTVLFQRFLDVNLTIKNDMENENKIEIKLVQVPIIQHKLSEVGKRIDQRIAKLNIGSQLATEETIQYLKKQRAELNKEHKELDDYLKSAISPITDVVTEIKSLYKINASEKYKTADDLYKDKITAFELTVKTEKQKEIVTYFTELCESEKIDFLEFKHTGIEVNLSTSPKQYKEKCNAFVQRVSDDLLLINSMEHSPEIMVEYKSNNFNASQAIKTVTDRKEAEKLEEDRKKQAEIDRRNTMLRSLAMVHSDMTKTMNYASDNNIFITDKEIEGLPKDEFNKLFVEVESKIKAKHIEEKATLFASSAPGANENAPVEKPVDKPVEPLSAPVQKAPEAKKVKASFEVTGTMDELMALKQYLIDNNLTYKNL
jgi:hypothetical protein